MAGPSGEWFEQPQERPQAVSVRLLGSTMAAVSWAPSSESHNGSLVSVLSMTCLKPSLSQRMENTYCSEVGLDIRLSTAQPTACKCTTEHTLA